MIEILLARLWRGVYHTITNDVVPTWLHADSGRWLKFTSSAEEIAETKEIFICFEYHILQHHAPNKNQTEKILMLCDIDNNIQILDLDGRGFSGDSRLYYINRDNITSVSNRVLALIKDDMDTRTFKDAVKRGLKNL